MHNDSYDLRHALCRGKNNEGKRGAFDREKDSSKVCLTKCV